jgi:hypothetical protein
MRSDWCMCLDDSCPARFDCRRHADSGTVASDRQSYSDFCHDKSGKCEGYWHVTQPDNTCQKCGVPIKDTDTIIFSKLTGVLIHADCNKV